nr:hypothetical protein [Tanacetum cinerariifolium]
IYKVKLDEYGDVLKNKARLVAKGYRQEKGIDFEESFASVKDRQEKDKIGSKPDKNGRRGEAGRSYFSPYLGVKNMYNLTNTIPPLSPAYVPDPMELDEHVPVYVLELKHPEYHAPSDDDIQDDDEDLEEDPSEEHEPEDDDEDPEEDPNEDPNEEPKPKDEDTKEEELSKGFDETESFEKDETAVTPPLPPRHRRARISVRPQIPMATSTQALIDAFAAGSPPFLLPPTSPAYDQEPLGHRASMIRMRDDIPEEDMPPQRRFSLVHSLGHDAWIIARAVDRAENAGYVRALHASEHRMMTSIKEVNLRISYQAQVHSKRLEDCLRDRVAGDARAWTDTMEDAGSSCGGPRRPVQPARVYSYIDFMKYQPWNFDGTKGVVFLSQWLENMESVFYISGCAIDNQVKFATCTLLGTLKKKLTDKYYPKGEIKKLEIELWNLRVNGNDVAAYTQRFQELALMCTKFLTDETKNFDKYISGLPDNIHGNVMSARPKTLDETTELANDLMDQKLRTYAERHNDNKRKADDSSRNNQQQQPHNKQNVARAYTASPGEKKAYTRNLPLCTKCNYHHTRQWHFKKNFLKLKNNGNANGNGRARGKAYVLGGRDSNLKSNTVMLKPKGNQAWPKTKGPTGLTTLLEYKYPPPHLEKGVGRGKLRTSFRAPSNLNDGNATPFQLLDFTIHDSLVLQQSGAYHLYGVHPMESREIHRINTSSELTRGTCYEPSLIVMGFKVVYCLKRGSKTKRKRDQEVTSVCGFYKKRLWAFIQGFKEDK